MTQKTFDGQTANFLAKVITSLPGDLNGDEMQKCIDDPKGLRDAIRAWVRPINQNNGRRITFEVVGTGFTAKQWVDRFTFSCHKLSDWALDILSTPDYDKKHRLECGKVYKVVLVRGKEIPKDSYRTTKVLKAFAKRELGEESVTGLKAELSFLIREKFTNVELADMGLWYIAVLHEQIVDSSGSLNVIYLRRHDDESIVHTNCGGPADLWDDRGAFAFFAS